jgi:hypothetical protein
MDKLCTYHLRLHGQVEAGDLNAGGPLHVTVVEAGTAATELVISTDQAGIIGLLRHLHGRGFVLLSVDRQRVL